MRKYWIALTAVVLSATLLLAHGDATHLTGTITKIQGDHIEIKDLAGKLVIVMLGKTTKYLKPEKKASTKAELKVGTRVVIDAKMDAKMKMYTAEEVTIGVTTAPKAK